MRNVELLDEVQGNEIRVLVLIALVIVVFQGGEWRRGTVA